MIVLETKASTSESAYALFHVSALSPPKPFRILNNRSQPITSQETWSLKLYCHRNDESRTAAYCKGTVLSRLGCYGTTLNHLSN